MYKTYALNKIFIEGLDALIPHSMHKNWNNMKDAILHYLTFFVALLLWSQGHDVASK